MSGRFEASDQGVFIQVDNGPDAGSRSFRDALKAVQKAITSKGAALFGEQHSTVAPALWARSKGQIALFERWNGTRWTTVGSLSNTGVLDVIGDVTVNGNPIAGGSGTPASTVEDETTYGISPSVGTDTEYARQDHTHGTPAAPSIPSAAGTVAAETSFGIASSAGAAATFSRGDHTHGTPAAPRKVTMARAYVTSGDITLPNTSAAWALLSTSSIPELSISGVVAGDEIVVEVHCLSSATTNNYFDVAVVTGGGPTAQRYLSSGTGTPAIEGNPGFYPALNPLPAGQSFTATSGDIDSGSIRLRIATLSAGARTLYASTNYPFFWQVTVFPQ